MLTISAQALQQLAAILLERAGLKIASDGFHSLRLALQSRMPVVGATDAEHYVQQLKQPSGEFELRALLPLVTVGHTEFFRDSKQFQALERQILPELLERARREKRKVQIWSAGCATGEEPYSLAMVLCELGAEHHEVDLWATDLNPAAVTSAQAGRFSARRVSTLSEARQRRFFQPAGDQYEVVPSLRAFIRFDAQNLALPLFTKVVSGSLDLILCRNVIIYFDLPTIRGLMDRFYAALRPDALLLLGYSESLFKVYDRFEMVDIQGAFVYQRSRQAKSQKPQLPAEPTPTPRIAAPCQARPPPAPASKPRPAPASPVPALPAPALVQPPEAERLRHEPPQVRLGGAVRKMEMGQFNSALEVIEKLLADEPSDLDALLTLGNLYSLLGRASDARMAFAQVVNREPLCVEARVFGGVAALQANSLDEARSELSKALFLEPTLAIGHYLLAQVHERSKQYDAARRSYRNAIAQLRFTQRPLAGHYPEMLDSSEAIARAARYALAALEEHSG